MRKYISILITLISTLSFGQVHKVVSYGVLKEVHVFLPDTMNSYPAIAWYHGLNGRWDGDPGIGQQMRNGLNKKVAVYAPQNPDQGDWSKIEISNLVALMKLGKHPSYTAAGYSQGGMAAVSSFYYFPDFWFASAICAGKTALTDYDRYKKINIRAWHGSSDPTMGNSIFRFIDSVAAHGGNSTKEIYPVATHAVCGWAFDSNFDKGFWKWYEALINPIPPKEPDPVTSIAVLNGEAILTTASGSKFKIKVE